MRSIRNDYCIRMFVGFRPKLSNVNLRNGYLYATNGRIAAKIKEDLCIQDYKEDEKYPDAESVISSHKSIEKKTVMVDDLFSDLMKAECCFKPKMVNCEECDGKGTMTCEYCDSEYKCKECKGTGEMPGEELVLSGEHDCIVLGRKYKLKFLDLIIKTAIYTGVKEIQISNSEGSYGNIFYVGDFTILLMPMRSE